MKSTREKVLYTLAENPKSTIVEIADSVGINTISVRHHLTSLQASGLVMADEERHGVGRPRLVYSLTENGVEKFPTRYYQLTNRLLNQLKETLSKSELKKLFMDMADKISQQYEVSMKPMDLEQKLNLLKDLMVEEGHQLVWNKTGDNYFINEISCPFFHIGKEHPELCLLDKFLISNLLDISENKIIHIRDKENNCKFIIEK